MPIQSGKGQSLIRKLTLCKMGMCPFTTASDDHACWGECTICGKRAGYTTRKAIRAYMDAEDAARRAHGGRT